MTQPAPLISYTVLGTAFTDAVNAAITALNNLIAQADPTGSTLAEVESYAHQVDSKYDTLIAERFGSTSSTVAEIESFAHAISDAVVQVGGVANAAEAGISQAVESAAAARSSAAAAAAAATVSESLLSAIAVFGTTLDSLQATVPLNSRPGDNPDAFTIDLYAGSTGLPPTALPVTGIGGQSLRVTGAITLGNIGLRSIEPNRLYKVRAAFRRVVDTADPAGAAVTFAVAWYGADRNLLPLPSTEVATVRLAVASGRVQYEALFSPNPPDQTDLGNPRVAQPPAGAAYLRPFLRTFADDVVTDLEVIEHADVTDVAFPASLPLDAVLARLARVEAALNLPAM